MHAPRLAALFALSVAAAAHADPVTDSFERMLTHAPAAVAVARPVEPADPLVAALVAPLRDGYATTVAARADDPVRASFSRMLDHAPTHTRAPVPAGTDPLVAALVVPLRDGPAARTMVAATTSAVVR